MNSNSEQAGQSRKWVIVGLAVVAVVVVGAALFFLLPGPTPEEVARGGSGPQVGYR